MLSIAKNFPIKEMSSKCRLSLFEVKIKDSTMKIDGFGELPQVKKALRKLDKLGKDKEAPVPKSGQGQSDTVELSSQAKMANAMKNVPDVRSEKVREIKEQIAKGEYLTPEKLNQAIDNLLQDLL